MCVEMWFLVKHCLLLRMFLFVSFFFYKKPQNLVKRTRDFDTNDLDSTLYSATSSYHVLGQATKSLECLLYPVPWESFGATQVITIIITGSFVCDKIYKKRNTNEEVKSVLWILWTETIQEAINAECPFHWKGLMSPGLTWTFLVTYLISVLY
jgi:hypothetical protein